MERLKSIIVVAPFFALAVAVAFLHGYWGAFGVLAFPYLSFQELVAYSAAPVFGFLLFAGAGMMFGAINATASTRSPRSKWFDRLQDIFLVALAAFLVYQKAPYRWVFAPLVVLGALLPAFFHWEPVQKLKQAYPATPLIAVLAVFVLVGSFGYGRSLAEQLQQSMDANACITWDSGASEEVKLIGRLGTHYFYLDGAGLVNVRAEQYVKQIKYVQARRGGSQVARSK